MYRVSMGTLDRMVRAVALASDPKGPEPWSMMAVALDESNGVGFELACTDRYRMTVARSGVVSESAQRFVVPVAAMLRVCKGWGVTSRDAREVIIQWDAGINVVTLQIADAPHAGASWQQIPGVPFDPPNGFPNYAKLLESFEPCGDGSAPVSSAWNPAFIADGVKACTIASGAKAPTVRLDHVKNGKACLLRPVGTWEDESFIYLLMAVMNAAA